MTPVALPLELRLETREVERAERERGLVPGGAGCLGSCTAIEAVVETDGPLFGAIHSAAGRSLSESTRDPLDGHETNVASLVMLPRAQAKAGVGLAAVPLRYFDPTRAHPTAGAETVRRWRATRGIEPTMADARHQEQRPEKPGGQGCGAW